MPLAPGQSFEEYMAEDQSAFPFRAGIVCIVLVTIAYVLRLVARRLQRAPWGWDDTLMIPAYLTAVATSGTVIYAGMYGSGHHVEWFIANMWPQLDIWGLDCMYLTAFCALFAVTTPKLALLVLYLRVFIDSFTRWCCWITMVILVMNLVVNCFTIGFQCDHFDYGWKPWMWPGHCNNVLVHYTWASFPNILTDVIMLLMPVPALWRLKLSLQVKTGVVLTLLLGSFGLVTSIIRFVEFSKPALAEDITWNAARLEGWTTIEASIYCISACLVTYRPLLRRLLGRHADPSTWYSYKNSKSTQDSAALKPPAVPPKDPPRSLSAPPRYTWTNADVHHGKAIGAHGNSWTVETRPMPELGPSRPKAAIRNIGRTIYDEHPPNCTGCHTCLYSDLQRSMSVSNIPYMDQMDRMDRMV